jgi:hypothetical protein
MLRQLPFQTSPDGVMSQQSPSLDLFKTSLDFADEPVVVANGSLDRFSRQHFRGHASAIRSLRQLALEITHFSYFPGNAYAT